MSGAGMYATVPYMTAYPSLNMEWATQQMGMTYSLVLKEKTDLEETSESQIYMSDMDYCGGVIFLFTEIVQSFCQSMTTIAQFISQLMDTIVKDYFNGW